MSDLKRRRTLGWVLITLFVAAGLGWLSRLDYGRKISTDVLDLLPSQDRDPELGIVRELASQTESRVMLFVIAAPDHQPVPEAATARFAAAL